MEEKIESYDPREIDFTLREIVNNVYSRIDQVCYGLYDAMDDEEKTIFANDLKLQSSKMYQSIYDNIVEKANRINILHQELKQTQEIKNTLYNIIAHDMKNPIVAILNYVDILLAQDDIPEEYYSYIKYVKSSSLFLNNMILNLLDTAKMEDKSFVLNKEISTFSAIFDEVLPLFELHIEMKNIEIRRNIRFDREISIDKGVFSRVILNILSNAFKYTPQEGFIEVKVSGNESGASFELMNNGPAMPKDNLERVFEKYYSVDSGAKYKIQTGIGLTFCKMAIEICGGTIKAVSPLWEDYGTGFVIHFPTEALADDTGEGE